MKMTSQHYRFLEFSISGIPATVRERTRKAIIEKGKYNDLEKCVRWYYLTHAVPSNWICDNLYPYLNDEHIDTALISIMKGLT